MSPKLPQVSGARLIRVLENLGYQVLRQKGSHIRLKKATNAGDHNITIPNHKTIAKGTFSDIITKVALANSISKDELIRRL